MPEETFKRAEAEEFYNCNNLKNPRSISFVLFFPKL
jgi:hypothetical protein